MKVRALTLTATIATMVAVPALRASAQDVKPDWREMNAYTMGLQAAWVGDPVVMAGLRWPGSAETAATTVWAQAG
jgi:hypothetical protein